MIQVASTIDELKIILMKKLDESGNASNELAKTRMSQIKLAEREAADQKGEEPQRLSPTKWEFSTHVQPPDHPYCFKDDFNGLRESLGELLSSKDDHA